MNQLLQKIKSRGYWKIVIRPIGDFIKDRIPEIMELKEIVRQANVRLRGWDFPHIRGDKIQIGIDWIEQGEDWSVHVETWRLYQSGQFVFFGSIWADWSDQEVTWLVNKSELQPGTTLYVEDAVLRYTEIFEFAARLAMTKAGGEQMSIQITLDGLENRSLVFENYRRTFHYKRTCSLPSFPQKIIAPLQHLVSEPKLLALEAAKDLLARFNWETDVDLLRTIQDEVTR